jgi:hypothetical protein
VFAHEEHVDADQDQRQRRQQHHVQSEEARERDDADAFPAEQAHQIRSPHGSSGRDLRRDHGFIRNIWRKNLALRGQAALTMLPTNPSDNRAQFYCDYAGPQPR